MAGERAGHNPFDILLLFLKRAVKPYWIETGTPRLLTELLFRTGWLAITGEERRGWRTRYRLGLP